MAGLDRQLGSSPLARGTRLVNPHGAAHGRFIPAGAGNTQGGLHGAHAVAVHPRWRGEHISTTLLDMRSAGSSPLARGTPEDARGNAQQCRFIPAGAGNTSGLNISRDLITVHPRWRGEHFSGAAWSASSVGSSPLARGTRSLLECVRR